jgi:hypothetical protein
MVRLQSGLLRALAPFPDARAAVIKMLADLEAGEYKPVKLNGAGHALPAPVEKTSGSPRLSRIFGKR